MSQAQGGPAPLRWRPSLPSKNTSSQLDAALDVRIVLDLKAWVGKPARIYMVMPPLAPSGLTIQWVGHFARKSAISGAAEAPTRAQHCNPSL